MPELPEVETTRRGVRPHVIDSPVTAVQVRQRRLRWPVPDGLEERLAGGRIRDVERRGKYLLFRADRGTILWHLGMSGAMRIVTPSVPPGPHDHVDLRFASGVCLRYTDPRRFGSIHWCDDDPYRHPLLASLGPEPLGEAFTGAYLYERSRGRRVAVKAFVMDARTVVGVGNIYAAEALFRAGIHPSRAAGRVGPRRYRALTDAVRAVLHEAIAVGGTTLRDFHGSEGQPGYFRLALDVYGRAGAPCPRCGGALRGVRIGQRATTYCARCQR